RPPQREVHHANVVLALELDGALNGGDDVAVTAYAIAVQHTQVDQVGVGRDAAQSLGGIRRLFGGAAVSGDDSCHVRAVPVVVVNGLIAGETLSVHDSGAVGILGAQVRDVFDAAVQNRDADTGSIPAVVECDVAGDSLHCVVQSPPHLAIGRY